MEHTAEHLIEHYQKTYEITYSLWQQRNRTFLVLIAVVAFATLLTLRPGEANPLLLGWFSNFLNINEPDGIKAFRNSFPFALVHGILLTVVFYLMVNLFHRSLYVLRNYAYLGALEGDIRTELKLPKDSVGFTRESSFYWNKRPMLLGTVKWFYILLLCSLLMAFLGGRIHGDFTASNWMLLAVDIGLAVPISVYFVGYAYYSLRLDSRTAIIA
jgi:hypothetical protein